MLLTNKIGPGHTSQRRRGLCSSLLHQLQQPRCGSIVARTAGKWRAIFSDLPVSKADGNTLRMALPKNASKANRLYITLDATDTYTMHFFKYTAGHLNKKTFSWIEDKTVEVKTVSGVFFYSLQPIFTEVTGMYTHL